MKKILIWVLALNYISVQALDINKFKNSSFNEIIKSNPLGEKTEPASFVQNVTTPAYKVTATYTGQSREISPGINFFFAIPSSLIQSKKKFFSSYTKEIEVKEGDRTYWIPVQKQVFPFVEKEVKQGQKISMYIRYYGTLVGKSVKQTQPVFLMIDFVTE